MQWGTCEDIRRTFRKYGAIEQLELYPEKYPIHGDGDEYYAYVTYADAVGAYRAVRDGKRIRSNLFVTLADTWKQPDMQRSPPYVARDDEISLSRLNEYCLLEIFSYLDLASLLSCCGVSEHISSLIHNRVLPLQHKFSLELKPEEVNLAWEIFGNVVPHARQMRLEMSPYEQPPNAVRLMDHFAKNLGAHLERLELVNVRITDRLFDQMKPVFMRLKVFKWDSDHYVDEGFEFDFVNCFPELRKVKLMGEMDFNINTQHWSSLESATIGLHQFHDSNFFKNNQQLKRLKIDICHMFSMVSDICFYLPDLEVLKIYCYDEGDARSFRDLVKLKQLKTLRLGSASFLGQNYQDFMNILGELDTLEKLDINVEYVDPTEYFEPAVCRLASLGRKLTKLKEFYIGRYVFTEDTLLAFLEATPQLTVFKFAVSKLQLTEELLNKIARLRRRKAKGNTPLPLKIFSDNELPSVDKVDDIVSVHEMDKDPGELEFI